MKATIRAEESDSRSTGDDKVTRIFACTNTMPCGMCVTGKLESERMSLFYVIVLFREGYDGATKLVVYPSFLYQGWFFTLPFSFTRLVRNTRRD